MVSTELNLSDHPQIMKRLGEIQGPISLHENPGIQPVLVAIVEQLLDMGFHPSGIVSQLVTYFEQRNANRINAIISVGIVVGESVVARNKQAAVAER